MAHFLGPELVREGLALRAETDGMSYRDYLGMLITEEIAHRAETRIQRGAWALPTPARARRGRAGVSDARARRGQRSVSGRERALPQASANHLHHQQAAGGARASAPGDLAEAILDRVLERGTHFVMRGRSWRLRDQKQEDVVS